MNLDNTRIVRPVLAIFAAIGLSACASVESVDYNNYRETSTRSVPIEASTRPAPVDTIVVGRNVVAPISPEPSSVPIFLGDYKVVQINVSVPETLKVNEANRYYPSGDIVWREDPIGNRHEQVKSIVAAGLAQGTAELGGSHPVAIDVVVRRFHALTEKARYTIGGVHSIQFDMRVRDAQTGAVLIAPKFVKADFDALGGQAAIQAESKGVTQKVRITNHLAHVIQLELTTAEGFAERETGLIGAINQL